MVTEGPCLLATFRTWLRVASQSGHGGGHQRDVGGDDARHGVTEGRPPALELFGDLRREPQDHADADAFGALSVAGGVRILEPCAAGPRGGAGRLVSGDFAGRRTLR